MTVDGVGSPRFRTIRPADAPTLSTVAARSKAYWGYDTTFMRQASVELTWVAEDLARPGIRGEIAGNNGAVAGFYLLEMSGHPECELDALYVDPLFIRQGIGSALLGRAIDAARRTDATCLMIQSDPNAEGFYQAMGAESVGTAPSGSIPGRLLPLLRLTL